MPEISASKIIFYELGFLFGLMFILAVGRIIFLRLKAVETKMSALGKIKKLKKGELTRTQVARTLDIPYHKLENISPQKYQALMGYIREGIRIGDYTILYAGAVDNKRFIVSTELATQDSYVDSEGTLITTTERFHHDFLLTYDSAKCTLASYSTLYEDATDKFQKHEFLKRL